MGFRQDVLEQIKKINVPIVLDYHHYICNRSELDIDRIFKSWGSMIPKIHFSSSKNKLIQSSKVSERPKSL